MLFVLFIICNLYLILSYENMYICIQINLEKIYSLPRTLRSQDWSSTEQILANLAWWVMLVRIDFLTLSQKAKKKNVVTTHQPYISRMTTSVCGHTEVRPAAGL